MEPPLANDRINEEVIPWHNDPRVRRMWQLNKVMPHLQLTELDLRFMTQSRFFDMVMSHVMSHARARARGCILRMIQLR